MDKAFTKIIDILPLPILLSLAIIFAIAWLIKEIKKFSSFGEVINKSRVFRVLSLIVIILTIIYYGIVLFLNFYVPLVFKQNERGVYIARFENDLDNKIQLHTIETLKTAICNDTEFKDVRIKSSNKIFKEHIEASNFCKSSGACLCIWGTIIEPTVMHFKFSTPKEINEARIVISDYPEFIQLKECFKNSLINIPSTLALTSTQSSQRDIQQNELIKMYQELSEEIKVLEKNYIDLKNTITYTTKNNDVYNEIIKFEKQKKRIILIIGISDYQSFPSLQYSSHDALKLYESLKKIWSNDIDSILLKDSMATKQNILNSMDNISKKAQPNDQVWLYFSGHGLSKNNEGYLIPSDGNSNALFSTSISISEIISWFNEIAAKQVIMLVDACYSGAFNANSTKGIEPISQFQLYKNASGRIVITAGRANEIVFEDNSFGQGVFSYYIIKGLEGLADNNSDGIITINELFPYISNEIISYGMKNRNIQHPTMYTTSDTYGDIIISLTN